MVSMRGAKAFCTGLALLLALVLVATPVAAQQVERVDVLIGFARTPGPAEQAIVRGAGGDIKYTYHLIPAIAASIPERAIQGLLRNPNVTHVNMDGPVFAVAQTLPWGVNRIDAEAVHAAGNRGAGVKVAVLDTGIDLDHPDVRVAGGVTLAGGKDADDKNGHGTHVAGTIAALDNSIGAVGVAPEAKLYAVKVLGNGGTGSWSGLIAGIEWSVDNGMQVANMSLGASLAPIDVGIAVDAAYARGLLLVAAAGNDYGGPVIYPAAYDSVIAVSATDRNDALAGFSNQGAQVELAAPGYQVYSTYKSGGYAELSGTSMAAPHVSGVAALMISSGVSGAGAVRARLQSSAEDLGAAGRDYLYGYGLVDAEKAVLGTTNGNNLPGTTPATGTIAGTVTDVTTSAGIGGATVVVQGTTLSTSTNGSGGYTITGVLEGARTVTASASGYQSASQDVQVVADQTTNANFALSSSTTGTMYVSDINWDPQKKGPNYHLAVKVTIQGNGGVVVSGAQVSMALHYQDGSSWNFGGQTDGAGQVTFKLIGARQGSYTARVTGLNHPNYDWEPTMDQDNPDSYSF
jgi:subtilisin